MTTSDELREWESPRRRPAKLTSLLATGHPQLGLSSAGCPAFSASSSSSSSSSPLYNDLVLLRPLEQGGTLWPIPAARHISRSAPTSSPSGTHHASSHSSSTTLDGSTVDHHHHHHHCYRLIHFRRQHRPGRAAAMVTTSRQRAPTTTAAIGVSTLVSHGSWSFRRGRPAETAQEAKDSYKQSLGQERRRRAYGMVGRGWEKGMVAAVGG